MEIEWWLVRLALGAVIGFCIGLTGIGGGVLVMPALTLVLGLPASVAVGTASLYAFLTKCHATYEHFKIKTIDWTTSLLILAGAVPGNIVTSWSINRAVRRYGDEAAGLEQFQHGLKMFIASVVLFAAAVLVLDMIRNGRAKGGESGGNLARRLQARPVLRRVLAVVVGILIGALIGATSVGGGVLMIPAMIILFGLSSSSTVGTSIFVGVVLTLTTACVYGCGGQMAWKTALLMAGGSLVGVPIGSKLCVRLPERVLRGVVIVVVLTAAVLMFVKRGVAGH